MELSLIAKTDCLYSNLQSLEIKYHNLEYPELQLYTGNLYKFYGFIGEARLDDFWNQNRWHLRKISFLLSAAPLPREYLRSEIKDRILLLEDNLEICRILYPNFADSFQMLINNANSLLSTSMDEIRTFVISILANLQGSSNALLIKDTTLIPDVESSFVDVIRNDFEVVSTNSLKSNLQFENLLIVGPANPKWYPDYIFSSPRAKKIHVIKYRFMRGTWKPSYSFPKPLKSVKLPEFNDGDVDNNLDDLINSEFLLPSIDYKPIIRRAENEFCKSNDDIEYVDAVIGYLENEQIVFLDAEEASNVWIIDQEEKDKPLKKILVKKLEPEMVILLRTSGSGDYIIPIANRIMGAKAEKVREVQREWKDRLRKEIRLHKMDYVVNKLRSLGSGIASSINVNNWMSYRSIKTHNFNDFDAIMKLVGLDSRSGEIWQQMDLISRAHRKAGFHISKLLLNVVKSADFDQLNKLGVMEFELPDKDAGTITAFRIKDLSSDTAPVPISNIGTPMDI